MRINVTNNRFVRFVIVGTIAFAIHYSVYLILVQYFCVNVAYAVGYCVSLLGNLLLSAKFTFKCDIDTRKFIGFILAHAANFFLHIVFLNIILLFNLSEKIVPVIVLFVVVPINFVLVRFVLGGTIRKTMVGKKVVLSFDMEEFDLPIEMGDCNYTLADGLAVSSEGAKKLVEAIKTLNIHATFFCTVNFAQNNQELIRNLYSEGNEIASHGCSHLFPTSYDPGISKTEIEKIIGGKCYGYRQPRMKEVCIEYILECGYRYNSSLNPTFIPRRYCHLRSPRTIFSESELVQVPMSVTPVFRIPLFWLSFHIIPLPIYKFLSRRAIEKDGYLLLYFHPWEFCDLGKIRSGHIPSYISFNSGEKMLRRFNLFMEFLKSQGCEFLTINEFVQIYDSNAKYRMAEDLFA